MSDLTSRSRVLIIDDEPTNIKVLGEALKDEYKLIAAVNGEEGLACAWSENTPDIILLDIIMPGGDGYEVCRRLKNDERTKDIPVIFITALAEAGDESKGFELGAIDYITKPFSPSIVKARVETHLGTVFQTRLLKKQIMELNRLSRLKDDFLAVCSHDLRSPLTVILGLTDLMLVDPEMSSDHKDCLKDIKRSAESQLSLVNDLLDLSRIESAQGDVEKIPLCLAEIAHSCVNMLRHTASPKCVSLQVLNRVENENVLGNLGYISRILNNLLSNAVKFTPFGGSVTVELFQKDATTLVVSVSDTGLGIAKEKLPQLFDKFSILSRKGTAGERGTGLGLAITKELVARLGGSIEVTSEPGKGSCFQVAFPKERACPFPTVELQPLVYPPE
ncbi:MAG: hybrid sensor histidine kinase/response regulator [Pseudomonadota bacterium]